MLAKLFQVLFVPKRARKTLAADRNHPVPEAAGGGRERLLAEAMALYRRQRREVYETLDDATKRQIEAQAESAFGRLLRPGG